LCPKLSHRSLSPWKIFRCYKFFWNRASGTISYSWKAEDCEGHLPAKDARCFAAHRAGFFQGRNEDMRVFDPSDSAGFGFQWWCGSCSGPSHIAADYLCLEEKSWVPTGIQGGGSFKLMGNIVNPYDPMWHGSNGRISNGYKALGSDYWVSINDWKGLIDAHPRRVDLIFKIFLNPSSNDFTLIYNDFKLDSSLRYYHAGGSCPQGSCPSGPQIQHNDPRTGWQGSWFDRGCCCYASGTSPFGWYGGCGHGQFGYVVGVNSYSTQNRFAHTIDKNGNYVSPPVGSSKRSDGLIIRKEIWLHFT